MFVVPPLGGVSLVLKVLVPKLSLKGIFTVAHGSAVGNASLRSVPYRGTSMFFDILRFPFREHFFVDNYSQGVALGYVEKPR